MYPFFFFSVSPLEFSPIMANILRLHRRKFIAGGLLTGNPLSAFPQPPKLTVPLQDSSSSPFPRCQTAFVRPGCRISRTGTRPAAAGSIARPARLPREGTARMWWGTMWVRRRRLGRRLGRRGLGIRGLMWVFFLDSFGRGCGLIEWVAAE